VLPLITTEKPMIDPLARLIHRHRDEPSPTLPAEWALLRLLDIAVTNTLADDLRTGGTPWEAYEATERLWEMLPDSPGLYMFVWRPWFRFHVAETSVAAGPPKPDSVAQILYIGQAGASVYGDGSTLKQRYKSYRRHIRADPKVLWNAAQPMTRPQLSRYLALRPLEYWFTVVEDRAEVKSLESRLLAMFNPPMNKNELPRIKSRFKPPQPAFAKTRLDQ
jgi:hypothetical protein